MNDLQNTWLKLYQDYLDAAKAKAEKDKEPLSSNEVYMARKHADFGIASLLKLGTNNA